MSIKTKYAENPIETIVLTCESSSSDTLTVEPGSWYGDTHVLRFKGEEGSGSVHIDQRDLRTFIVALTMVADAYDRFKD
jgi:hypothetical protein